MSKHIHIANGETQGLAGPYEASPSRPAGVTQEPVILVFSQRPAARSAADETSPIEGFEHIGEVLVRLMARFSLPKMTLAQGRRGRNPAPAAHDPSWEDSDA
jgi:hypothetical protein